ncbi:MAG: YtxH domain-containing protein [Myxococcota bacterium]
MTRMQKFLENAKDKVSNLTIDNVLEAVGLQLVSRGSAIARGLPMLASFGAGLVVGAGSAILLTPKSGKESRKALTTWIESAFAKTKAKAKAVGEKVADEAESVVDEVSEAKDKVAKKGKSIAREALS